MNKPLLHHVRCQCAGVCCVRLCWRPWTWPLGALTLLLDVSVVFCQRR